MTDAAENVSGQMTNDEKIQYRLRFRYDTYKKVRTLFRRLSKDRGLTQKAMAARLGINESLVSKRLHGQANLTMDTLCDLARAMGARLEANVVLLDEIHTLDQSEIKSSSYSVVDSLVQSVSALPSQPHAGMAMWVQRDNDFTLLIGTNCLIGKETSRFLTSDTSRGLTYSPATEVSLTQTTIDHLLPKFGAHTRSEPRKRSVQVA